MGMSEGRTSRARQHESATDAVTTRTAAVTDLFGSVEHFLGDVYLLPHLTQLADLLLGLFQQGNEHSAERAVG